MDSALGSPMDRLTKRCFVCGDERPLVDFYRHPFMADGHLGKCKSCTKRQVRENYARNRAHYLAYEHARGLDPERRAYTNARSTEHRRRHPDRAHARTTVNNAVRDGRLAPGPCEVCGVARAEAHHDDYSRPLEVRWLCRAHHRAHHRN